MNFNWPEILDVPLSPSQKSSIILLPDSESSPPNYDEATDEDDYDIVNEYNRIPHENRNIAFFIAWPALIIRSNLSAIERSFPGFPVLLKLLCWKGNGYEYEYSFLKNTETFIK